MDVSRVAGRTVVKLNPNRPNKARQTQSINPFISINPSMCDRRFHLIFMALFSLLNGCDLNAMPCMNC